jgi:hypothetical protein
MSVMVGLPFRPLQLLDPELIEQDGELLVALVVADACRREVDARPIEEEDIRRAVDDVAIDARPKLGGGSRVRYLKLLGAIDLAIDPRVAEPGDVDVERGRRRVRAARKEVDEEVRGAREVGLPPCKPICALVEP